MKCKFHAVATFHTFGQIELVSGGVDMMNSEVRVHPIVCFIPEPGDPGVDEATQKHLAMLIARQMAMWVVKNYKVPGVKAEIEVPNIATQPPDGEKN